MIAIISMFRRREETLSAYSHPFPQAMYPSASVKTRNNTATDAVLPLPIYAARRVKAARKSEKYREVTDSSAMASKWDARARDPLDRDRALHRFGS
jgi:hypothetical protein